MNLIENKMKLLAYAKHTIYRDLPYGRGPLGGCRESGSCGGGGCGGVRLVNVLYGGIVVGETTKSRM